MPVAAAIVRTGDVGHLPIFSLLLFSDRSSGSRHPEKFILLFWWWSVNAAATHEKVRLPALPPPDARAGSGLSGGRIIPGCGFTLAAMIISLMSWATSSRPGLGARLELIGRITMPDSKPTRMP